MLDATQKELKEVEFTKWGRAEEVRCNSERIESLAVKNIASRTTCLDATQKELKVSFPASLTSPCGCLMQLRKN